MVFESLLPVASSTRLEVELERVGDLLGKFDEEAEAIRGIKLGTPPSSFLPFLVYEYGLAELTPFVPNLYDLIREGIAWQRVRGTHDAVARGLAWLDYTAIIEDPPARRLRWNLFQLGLDRPRDDEIDLPRIEGVAQLSVPVRSYFWRGYSGYDIRALDYGHTRYSETLYSTFSGRRIGGQAKWSFGREVETDHAMTQAELTALGVWTPPVAGDPLTWGPFPWGAFPWGSSAARARSVAMLDALAPQSAWVVFKDSDGDVIGYRRAKAAHRVQTVDADGDYEVGGLYFDVLGSSATIYYVEALTDFGDGYGETAVSAGVIFNATPTMVYPPGALWLPPGGLAGTNPIVASTPVYIEFGRTVRERLKFALRF